MSPTDCLLAGFCYCHIRDKWVGGRVQIHLPIKLPIPWLRKNDLWTISLSDDNKTIPRVMQLFPRITLNNVLQLSFSSARILSRSETILNVTLIVVHIHLSLIMHETRVANWLGRELACLLNSCCCFCCASWWSTSARVVEDLRWLYDTDRYSIGNNSSCLL